MTNRPFDVVNEDVNLRGGADIVPNTGIDADGVREAVLDGDKAKEPSWEEPMEKEVDVPPNGGYGWVCVACVATING